MNLPQHIAAAADEPHTLLTPADLGMPDLHPDLAADTSSLSDLLISERDQERNALS